MSRPPRRQPLDELIYLRLHKYPMMRQRDFAETILGITRLHMSAIEMGRRRPSLELALRWLAALGPKARLSMFGPLPEVEARIAAIVALQKRYPHILKAA